MGIRILDGNGGGYCDDEEDEEDEAGGYNARFPSDLASGLEATPEVLKLLEEALKMPKKPNWDARPDLALEQ